MSVWGLGMGIRGENRNESTFPAISWKMNEFLPLLSTSECSPSLIDYPAPHDELIRLEKKMRGRESEKGTWKSFGVCGRIKDSTEWG